MPKKTFGTCKNATECQRCDIGYVLKNYVTPLMQTLTNDVQEYNMKLKTTKCLNTAVMLAIFMLGRQKALKVANYCDTELTRKRYRDGIETPHTVLDGLVTDVMEKRHKQRYFYYILLTDGYFTIEGSEEKKFFPGHVFILEKIPQKDNSEPYFYFYQSYINQYDLKGHVEKNNKSLKISYKRACEIVSGLAYLFTVEHWDANCVKIWKMITFVDTTDLIGSKCKNNYFVCYKKEKVTKCLEHIDQYTTEKIKELSFVTKDPSKVNLTYGEPSMYDSPTKPLSNGELYQKLTSLKSYIQRHKERLSNK